MITATAWPTGHRTTEFDATPWFEQATDAQLKNLLHGTGACHWYTDTDMTDEIAVWTAFEGNEELKLLFEVCNALHAYDPTGETSGTYACEVDPDEAIVWLKVNRPHITLPKE